MRKPTHATTCSRQHACAGLAHFNSQKKPLRTLIGEKETTEYTDYTETRGNGENWEPLMDANLTLIGSGEEQGTTICPLASPAINHQPGQPLAISHEPSGLDTH